MDTKPWEASFNDAKSIIFLYLAFRGVDYPYHIHKFFKNSGLCQMDGLKTLNHPNKVSTLLKEMEKDNLVLKNYNDSKEQPHPNGHDRIFYRVNPNVIFLRFNYFLNDFEIQELIERDKKDCQDAFESTDSYWENKKFDWTVDPRACPECRERYVAMNCWKKKKDGACCINNIEETQGCPSDDDSNHSSSALLNNSNQASSSEDSINIDTKQKNEYQYEERPIPALIFEYCEPEKVFPVSRHDDNEWSETLFTENFKFSDKEIKGVLIKIQKFDYLTILLVIRDLLHQIIFSNEEGTVDIGSADVKSAVLCIDFPTDLEKRQKFIEELVDWKIFYKQFSRKFQINKISFDIEEHVKERKKSPSVLFSFLSYERIIKHQGNEFGIPHVLINNEIYQNLMVGINQLISKNLMDQRIEEKFSVIPTN